MLQVVLDTLAVMPSPRHQVSGRLVQVQALRPLATVVRGLIPAVYLGLLVAAPGHVLRVQAIAQPHPGHNPTVIITQDPLVLEI